MNVRGIFFILCSTNLLWITLSLTFSCRNNHWGIILSIILGVNNLEILAYTYSDSLYTDYAFNLVQQWRHYFCESLVFVVTGFTHNWYSQLMAQGHAPNTLQPGIYCCCMHLPCVNHSNISVRKKVGCVAFQSLSVWNTDCFPWHHVILCHLFNSDMCRWQLLQIHVQQQGRMLAWCVCSVSGDDRWQDVADRSVQVYKQHTRTEWNIPFPSTQPSWLSCCCIW